MRAAIGTLKIFLLAFSMLSAFALYWPGYFLSQVTGWPFLKQRNFMIKATAKLAIFCLNIHIEKEGRPPQAPFFLISNHLSYIDIVPIFMYMDCRFVAKQAVRNWPVIGYMMKAVDVIFADRTKKTDVKRVNDLLSNTLNQNDNIVLFPEGTTTGGDQVLPFRTSLLDYPAKHEIPVYYATINYRTGKNDPPAMDSVCFFGGRDPFHKHLLKLAKNRRIYCTIRFGEEPVMHRDRKTLANTLHQKVEQLLDVSSHTS